MTTKLHDMTKRSMQKLSKETNHQITIDDFEDIFALNLIADKVLTPHVGSDDMAILNIPIKCGNAYLSRPKLGAALWVKERLCDWFSDEPDMIDIGSVYCLSMGDNPQKLWEIETKKECRKILRKWWRGLTCTDDELQSTLESLSCNNVDDEKKSDPCGYGPIISLMCREYGNTAEYWMWEASPELINTHIADYIKRNESEVEASYRASLKGKNPKPPPNILKYRANATFAKKANEIRLKWLKQE